MKERFSSIDSRRLPNTTPLHPQHQHVALDPHAQRTLGGCLSPLVSVRPTVSPWKSSIRSRCLCPRHGPKAARPRRDRDDNSVSRTYCKLFTILPSPLIINVKSIFIHDRRTSKLNSQPVRNSWGVMNKPNIILLHSFAADGDNYWFSFGFSRTKHNIFGSTYQRWRGVYLNTRILCDMSLDQQCLQIFLHLSSGWSIG